MEATHLGAWMAGRTVKEVDKAINILAAAPEFKDEGWLQTAFEVIRLFPQKKYHSLGIPTWLYGHEPSTPFATDIAKYFDNSIREDTILTVAFGGRYRFHARQRGHDARSVPRSRTESLPKLWYFLTYGFSRPKNLVRGNPCLSFPREDDGGRQVQEPAAIPHGFQA